MSPRAIFTLTAVITDATTTIAPARTRVSVMHVVSISSEPSAIGTSTTFAAPPVIFAAGERGNFSDRKVGMRERYVLVLATAALRGALGLSSAAPALVRVKREREREREREI